MSSQSVAWNPVPHRSSWIWPEAWYAWWLKWVSEDDLHAGRWCLYTSIVSRSIWQQGPGSYRGDEGLLRRQATHTNLHITKHTFTNRKTAMQAIRMHQGPPTTRISNFRSLAYGKTQSVDSGISPEMDIGCIQSILRSRTAPDGTTICVFVDLAPLMSHIQHLGRVGCFDGRWYHEKT